MKTVKRIIALVMLCCMILTPAAAAHGADGDGVPPEVQEKFLADGGRIEYVDVTCMGPGYDGTYTHWDRRIEVRAGAPAHVLPHEYGHYIYHTTAPRWDKEHRDTLQALYDYYHDMDRACYSLDETFAVLYAVSCTGATGGPLREMIEYAEDLLLEDYN